MANLAIDRSSPMPYYEQLRRLLMELITQGGLKPGDLLPSEAELCERYGVSRTVVRQAVGELENQGWLRRQRGKGTFVAEPKLNEQFMQTTVGFFEDLTSKGHKVRSEVLRCELVKPSERVIKELQLSQPEPCVELVRLRAVNELVIAFTRSYLPNSLGNGDLLSVLRTADLETSSLYATLAEAAHISVASGRRWLEAVPASEELATHLDIEPGDPVLYIESTVQDARSRVIEYFEAWHRGDRTRLQIDVVASGPPMVFSSLSEL